MFRISLPTRLALLATAFPPYFTSSSDVAFYFPRFQPSTHVQSAGIPEINEALSLLSSQSVKVALKPEADREQSHWRQSDNDDRLNSLVETTRWLHVGKNSSKDASYASSTSSVASKTKCLQLLDRGIEILEAAGGLQSNGIRSVLLPLYVTKWEVLQGTAHLPRPTFDYAAYASAPTSKGVVSSAASSSSCYRGGVVHIPKHILYHSSRAILSVDSWSMEKGGALLPASIDTDCMVLAHFVKAFSILHTRPFNQSSSKLSTSIPSVASGSSHGISIKSSSRGAGAGGDSRVAHPSTSKKSQWSLMVEVEGGKKACMTLEIALERVDQLIERCKAAIHEVKKKMESRTSVGTVTSDLSSASRSEHLGGGVSSLSESPSVSLHAWKFYIPKLLLLKAMLIIGSSGHLLHAKKCVDEAAAYVHALQKNSHILLDGLREGERPAEPELGLFLLAQAEMMARIWNWGEGKMVKRQKSSSSSSNAPEMVAELDEDVFEAFDNAGGFYAAPFTTNTKADGIMDLSAVSQREFEVHAYAVCLLSLATVILGVPRVANTSSSAISSLLISDANANEKDASPVFSAVHQDKKPVFLPQQLFSLFPPFLSLDRPSSTIFSDSSRLRPFSVEEARRMAGVLLKRALELVRGLYPDDRDHPLAIQILSAMACLYADTRDYLYASGLFESARRGTYLCYGGPLSIEGLFLNKLRYEFLAGVGSEEEAKTAAHEIIQHLKEVDLLPSI